MPPPLLLLLLLLLKMLMLLPLPLLLLLKQTPPPLNAVCQHPTPLRLMRNDIVPHRAVIRCHLKI